MTQYCKSLLDVLTIRSSLASSTTVVFDNWSNCPTSSISQALETSHYRQSDASGVRSYWIIQKLINLSDGWWRQCHIWGKLPAYHSSTVSEMIFLEHVLALEVRYPRSIWESTWLNAGWLGDGKIKSLKSIETIVSMIGRSSWWSWTNRRPIFIHLITCALIIWVTQPWI